MRQITIAALLLGFPAAGNPSPALQPAAITVASYNIRHGRGIDDRVDLPRTAAVLRALTPDIVALQEVDHRVMRSDTVPQADSLGKLLGMHATFGSFFDYQGGEYGMAILSRWPILATTPIRLPDGNEPRIALRADIALPDGDTIAVINVHFDWVDNDTLRVDQARALAAVLDTVSLPWLLLGDFNDTPESRTLALFTSRAVAAAKPRNNRFTFSATEPVKEIDFIFAAPREVWKIGAAHVADEQMASDHRPVVAGIVLKRKPVVGER